MKDRKVIKIIQRNERKCWNCYREFSSWTKCILYHKMVVILWGLKHGRLQVKSDVFWCHVGRGLSCDSQSVQLDNGESWVLHSTHLFLSETFVTSCFQLLPRWIILLKYEWDKLPPPLSCFHKGILSQQQEKYLRLRMWTGYYETTRLLIVR